MPLVLRDDDGIYAASLLLRNGRQVVIPTETVYGLAANALDFDAVAEIFRIKGRPSTNPLIVHVHSIEQASQIATVDDRAVRLAQAFWPGPLTIVMEAHWSVAENVTAGGTTVGVRVPNHPITLRLLQSVGLPLAAPSANRSEGISPTSSTDVANSLGADSPPILEGGNCLVGIESTVIDITTETASILRPGAITRSQIEAVLGQPVQVGLKSEVVRSPGQMHRHYAPLTPSILAALKELQTTYLNNSALLYYSEGVVDPAAFKASVKLPDNPTDYAAGLYAALNRMDRASVELIVVETPPEGEEWLAIHDRLSRATTPQPK